MSASQPVRPVAGDELRSAAHAAPHLAAPGVADRLERRLLALRIAGWTKPMWGFGSASIWFQHVSRRAPSDILEFVALKVSAGFFHLHYFCFKRAFLLGQRRLRLVGLDCFALELDDLVRQIDNCHVSTDIVSNRDQRIQSGQQRLEALKASKDFSHHHRSSTGCVTAPMVDGRSRSVESRGRLTGEG